MIYATLLAYFLTGGFSAIFIKLAQKDYVNDTWEAIRFTFYYALFQILLFCAIPPYNNYHFSLKIAAYPFCFAIFSLTSQLLTLNALKNGPTSLTYVLLRFSVLVPTFLGLFLWHESFSGFQLAGLILFLACMPLFNHDSYMEGQAKKPISIGWLIISLCSAVMIGCAVVFTKKYMVESIGPIRDYLILFNVFIVIFCAAILPFKRFRPQIKDTASFEIKPLSKFYYFTLIAALNMDIANVIYMNYIAKYSSAFFFPLTSIITMFAILTLSVIILKERFSYKAQAGVILSLIAIYLLGLHN